MPESSKPTKSLIITRIFNASPKEVWAAWSKPALLKQWWGPKHFTAPTCKMDFTPGGKFLWCMRDKDGDDYWNTGLYKQIVPEKKLVYTDSFSDAKGKVVPASYYKMPGKWGIESLVTITFEDQDGQTKMTLQHDGLPGGIMSQMTKIGWNQSFDKLTDSLKQ